MAILKRAPQGTQAVALSGDLWNRLCDLVERSLRLSVAAPLNLSDSPAGKLLSITERHKETFPVLVTGDGGYKGGWYSGTLYGGTMKNADPTTNVDMPEGLTSGQTVVVVNEEENNLPTHWIADDTYVECDWDGAYYKNEDGKFLPIVRVSGSPVYSTDSAADLTVVHGTPTDTDTHSWHRNAETSGDAYGDGAVMEQFVTRLAASAPDGDGNFTIYYFTRKRTIDAGGRHIYTSEETQNTLLGTNKVCAS